MSKSIKRGPGRPPVATNKVLLSLKATPGATVEELGTNMPLILTLKEKKLVEKSGHRQTGRKGRPRSEFRLTLQGHNRVRSILAAQAKAAAEAEDTAVDEAEAIAA